MDHIPRPPIGTRGLTRPHSPVANHSTRIRPRQPSKTKNTKRTQEQPNAIEINAQWSPVHRAWVAQIGRSFRTGVTAPPDDKAASAAFPFRLQPRPNRSADSKIPVSLAPTPRFLPYRRHSPSGARSLDTSAILKAGWQAARAGRGTEKNVGWIGGGRRTYLQSAGNRGRVGAAGQGGHEVDFAVWVDILE